MWQTLVHLLRSTILARDTGIVTEVRPSRPNISQAQRRAGARSIRSSTSRREGTTQIVQLTVNKDLDKLGLLDGVTTFNFHLHLPHYAVTTDDEVTIHVLTQQPVDRERPHPFSAAGNIEFNSCRWMPPKAEHAGHIVMADSTIFTTLFGGGTA